ncbi:MAG: aminoacyl-tRNA hydrolase [Bryobacterales bacterium]|nr:aminoacyl-tRNA hydrolase [Bryobacterales bacterium]
MEPSDSVGPWLIVGLGNPGPEYKWTYHNLGFLVVERVAERNGIHQARRVWGALVAEGAISGQPVLIAKPQTFMNLSGNSVRLLVEKYAVASGRLVLIFDELALEWGTLRIRPKGSAGGHHGVQDVIRGLGTNEFARVRLGIHPGHPVSDGAAFVLAPIKRAQRKELDQLLDQAAQAVESIIAEGVEKSMTKFNRRAQGSIPEEA